MTALVCTADRDAMVVLAVGSILANAHPSFEVIVVDQSRDQRTADALESLHDTRVRYLHSQVRGKGAALNVGLAAAETELVACTDDDCVTPPEWLEQIEEAFENRPALAVVFGTVAPGPHDPTKGFVPDYRPDRERLITSPLEGAWTHGIGACMGLRRSAIEAVGGFDPSFGPGGRFPSCDDWDIAVRSLLGGFTILETPNVSVVHYGFRTFAEGRKHARRDWYAIGALCVKLLKVGQWRMLRPTLGIFVGRAVWPPMRDLLHMRRPEGIVRVVAFVHGFMRGLRTPVRRETILFQRPDQEASPNPATRGSS